MRIDMKLRNIYIFITVIIVIILTGCSASTIESTVPIDMDGNVVSPRDTIENFPDRVEYRRNGLLHRDDGPAVIYTNGVKIWYHKHEKYRVDYPNGETVYFN
jgi:hypothetical protein